MSTTYTETHIANVMHEAQARSCKINHLPPTTFRLVPPSGIGPFQSNKFAFFKAMQQVNEVAASSEPPASYPYGPFTNGIVGLAELQPKTAFLVPAAIRAVATVVAPVEKSLSGFIGGITSRTSRLLGDLAAGADAGIKAYQETTNRP